MNTSLANEPNVIDPVVSHAKKSFLFMLFGLAMAAASVMAQQSKPAPSESGTTSGRYIPCWKQIGISPAAMQQRRAIMEAARAKVQELCKNDSLTPQQRKEQLHQIHQEAMQQADGVIPAAQMAALKKCEQEQHASSGRTHTAPMAGPCGEPLEPEEAPAAQPN
jgi:hypothetical protein